MTPAVTPVVAGRGRRRAMGQQQRIARYSDLPQRPVRPFRPPPCTWCGADLLDDGGAAVVGRGRPVDVRVPRPMPKPMTETDQGGP
jgi:hypothetical protein